MGGAKGSSGEVASSGTRPVCCLEERRRFLVPAWKHPRYFPLISAFILEQADGRGGGASDQVLDENPVQATP